MSPMHVTLKVGVSHLPARVVTNEINTDMPKMNLKQKSRNKKALSPVKQSQTRNIGGEIRNT